ncbi:MAG: septum site-determining protein MinC [Rhodobacteraceae bacterium]|nr:septum site-determining protein MinC [Paracoccaceae bacterium]
MAEQENSGHVPKERTQARREVAPVSVKPFQVRGRFLTAIALRMEGGPLDEAFYTALDEQIEKSPHLLGEAPLMLDFAQAQDSYGADEIRDLVARLRARKLRVFGAEHAAQVQLETLAELGLIEVQVGRDAPLPKSRGKTSRADRLLPPDNKVLTRPVRSGQVVVADRGDLTVIGPVSSGAELAAAGSIHVYGPLRGRAIAGVHGDETARIFCHSQNAELLAIAGLYRTSESIEDKFRNRSVQVYLDKDKLCMEAL